MNRYIGRDSTGASEDEIRSWIESMSYGNWYFRIIHFQEHIYIIWQYGKGISTGELAG